MHKHTPKPLVKVTGKMNPQDAGIVGKRLAAAALIFAVGTAVAGFVYSIRWW